MIEEKNRIFDGFTSLAAGVDVGRKPSQIEKNQAHRLTNGVCRGGVGAETRPAIKAHALEWSRRDMTYFANGQFDSVTTQPPGPSQTSGLLIVGTRYEVAGYNSFDDFSNCGATNSQGEVFTATATTPSVWSHGSELKIVHGVPSQSESNFHEAVFQEAGYFAPRGTPACIMATVGGRLYKLIPNSSTGVKITEIELPARNRSNIKRAYMQQADRFHITQDGEARPIIFDGVTARRAKEDEVPVGTFMAYGMGRLVVCVNGRELTFGDLYGSNQGTDPGDSVVKFTETTFLNEGFNASIAFSLGAVTGLHFAPQQDSAVGDGELLAFSENGVSSFFLSQPRDVWKDSAFQRVTLLNIGGRSHNMIVSVNGDLWFRSDDGWRSYRQARAEIQGWAHLPMSTEIRDYMESDTPRLLKFGSAIIFNNRLLGTCTPRFNQGRLYHEGITSLDFDVLSSFGQATRPAWDGRWGKIRFVKLITGKFEGVNRAFAFGIDNAGRNQIYELMPEPGGDDFDGPISCTLECRAMDFNSPFNEKEILGGDLWVNQVSSEAVITLEYKSDQEPSWQPWTTLNVIRKTGTCQAVGCGGVPTVKPGYAPRRTIPMPLPTCSEQTRRKSTRFFEFQPKLTWTGHCVIDRLRLSATQLPEDSRSSCPQ